MTLRGPGRRQATLSDAKGNDLTVPYGFMNDIINCPQAMPCHILDPSS